jgi:hypothetical protein
LPKNDRLKVANVVQQIITELSESVSEEDKIMVITKMALWNKTSHEVSDVSLRAKPHLREGL